MKKGNSKIRFTFFYNDEVLATKVEELTLSQRALNGLKRAHYDTIGQIIDNWDKLNRIRAFGDKSIKEVKSAIFNYNIERMSQSQLTRFIDTFQFIEGRK